RIWLAETGRIAASGNVACKNERARPAAGPRIGQVGIDEREIIVFITSGSGDVPPNAQAQGQLRCDLPAVVCVESIIFLTNVLGGKSRHIQAGIVYVTEQKTREVISALNSS